MSTLVFKVEVPNEVEADILAAFVSTYGISANDAIVNLVKEVYSGTLIRAAVKSAQDRAVSDAAAVVITKDPVVVEDPVEPE
jgi:hypothetical protein